MSKYDIWPQFECQIGFGMSKYDIRLDFEFQNIIFKVKIRYSKIHEIFKMSKYDIWSDFEYQNRIWNVKVLYLASVRMPNMILNVKIRYSA